MQYYFGVSILFFGFSLLGIGFKENILVLLSIVTGIICIPFTRNYLESALKFQFSKKMKYGITLTGYLFLLVYKIATLPPHSSFSVDTARNHNIGISTDTISQPSQNEINSNKVVENKKIESHSTKDLKAQPSELKSDVKYGTKVTKETPQKKSKVSKKKSSSYSSRSYSSGREYYTGPRGGCYYYSGSGKKVYVDRSLCH